MSTRLSPLHLIDRVRTLPTASALASGFEGDGAKSRIIVGPIAQPDRQGGADAETLPPLSTLPPTPEAWAEQDDRRLIEFLVERYHAPLRDELPRLQGLAARTRREDEVHRRAARLVDDLAALLLEHLDEEEDSLFPAILGDDPFERLAGTAVDDHQVALRLLGDLRALCASSTSSSDPICRALAHGLLTLERELVEHIRLEVDVLLPRVVQRRRAVRVVVTVEARS